MADFHNGWYIKPNFEANVQVYVLRKESVSRLGNLLGIIKMFWNWIVVMVAQHCECTKCHWIVHFKIVNFILYEFYLNQIDRYINK